MLADIYSANGQTSAAFMHLKQVSQIAVDDGDKTAEAAVSLHLGLLYNKEGPERNPKQSADYF